MSCCNDTVNFVLAPSLQLPGRQEPLCRRVFGFCAPHASLFRIPIVSKLDLFHALQDVTAVNSLNVRLDANIRKSTLISVTRIDGM